MPSRRLVLTALLAASLSGLPAGGEDDRPVPVGTARQLFVDDHLIASRRGLERIYHEPDRHPANPVLIGDQPWERWVIEVNGRAVVWDEQAGELRMYYVAPEMDPSAPLGERFKTCLAVSRDGLHWERPELNQLEWGGSRRNNILKRGVEWMRRPNVMIDSADPDPGRRYKMTYVDYIEGQTAIMKAFSADGIQWRLNADGKPWFRPQHSSNLLGWDPRIGRYVFFPRMPGRGKSIGRSTSLDFTEWTEPETILEPEPHETDLNFAGNAAFLYEGVYLGLLWVFEGRRSAESELVISRDGLKWRRATPGRPYFRRGRPGSWDDQMILPVAPLVWKDKIWIYYSGWNLPYSQQALRKAHEGWIEKGRRMHRAVGLATLRLDGFASLSAGSGGGELVTRPLICPGGTLEINADLAGDLRLEVLDRRGRPLPGLSGAECRPLRGDGLRQAVSWTGQGPHWKALAGQEISLRFTWSSGRLYSFRFVPE